MGKVRCRATTRWRILTWDVMFVASPMRKRRWCQVVSSASVL
jgi:hypothetical protein